MREDISSWNRKKNENHWQPFLKFFETAPMTGDEFKYILRKEEENNAKNFIKHSDSHFNPVRKCLNAIYSKNRFIKIDLTEIDDNFLSGVRVNFKEFLKRIEKYPMSHETFNRLIESPNTTGNYERNKQNFIKVSQDILIIANRLHTQEKFNIENTFFSAEEVASDLEKMVLKAKSENQRVRRDKLREAPRLPEQIQVTSVGYKRNPYVIDDVLRRADGVCEQCNKEAPFVRKKDQTPYLEVHHKVMLSDGGEDTIENTIALCPNCHRERHFGV